MLFSFSFILTVVLCGERVNNIQVLEKSKKYIQLLWGDKVGEGEEQEWKGGGGGGE